MVAQLTIRERRLALLILLIMGLVGLFMTVAGADKAFSLHGLITLIFSVGLMFVVLSGYFEPEPDGKSLQQYYDDPTKVGIVIAMIWAVFGMFIGDWVAWLLAYPEMTFNEAWASFGRLRPVHTTAVIFGFGGNGLIATSYHVVQRTSRARLPGQVSPWFVLFGYNLFCIISVTGFFIGVTQSKEYAEPEWYADIWLVIVWVTYFIMYLRVLARRNEPH